MTASLLAQQSSSTHLFRRALTTFTDEHATKNVNKKVLTLFILFLLISCAHGFDKDHSYNDLEAKEAELTIRPKILVGDGDTVKIICPFGKNLNEAYRTEVRGAFVRPVSVCMMKGKEEKCGLKENLNEYGCTPYGRNLTYYDSPSHAVPTKGSKEPWVVFVKRGSCTFDTKLKIAKEEGASAIVVYNNNTDEKYDYFIPVPDAYVDLPIVNIGINDAKKIMDLFNLNREIEIDIRATGNNFNYPKQSAAGISKTSVLFVSISFIVLMIISLAWLLFYYIQRFRYSHAKERLARRLACAAKKAITKIPQRTIKTGDKELDPEFDQCAICIEPYKGHEVIRILPCRHIFHKSCVDPWLLDQRSCPMCKMDILRAYGMQIGGSQDSMQNVNEQGRSGRQEPEVSSSMEEGPGEEVRVMLVPHTCLHYVRGEPSHPAHPSSGEGRQGASASGGCEAHPRPPRNTSESSSKKDSPHTHNQPTTEDVQHICCDSEDVRGKGPLIHVDNMRDRARFFASSSASASRLPIPLVKTVAPAANRARKSDETATEEDSQETKSLLPGTETEGHVENTPGEAWGSNDQGSDDERLRDRRSSCWEEGEAAQCNKPLTIDETSVDVGFSSGSVKATMDKTEKDIDDGIEGSVEASHSLLDNASNV